MENEQETSERPAVADTLDFCIQVNGDRVTIWVELDRADFGRFERKMQLLRDVLEAGECDPGHTGNAPLSAGL